MADEPQEVAALRQVLGERQRVRLDLPGFRESAVLVPLVFSAQAPLSLLLTVRHADLPTHAGQIAFPGGKRDPGDPTLQHTALREAAEELGIDTSGLVPLGLLDDVPSPSGFLITPVVAALRGPLTLHPSQREVAEVFYAPLSLLPEGYRQGPVREFLGLRYIMHEYACEGRRIWGATAAMVGQLLSLMSIPIPDPVVQLVP